MMDVVGGADLEVSLVSSGPWPSARDTRSTGLRPFARRLLMFVILALLIKVTEANAQELKATAPVPLAPPDGTRLDGVPAFVVLTADPATGHFVPAVFDHRFEVYRGGTRVALSLVTARVADLSYRFVGPMAEDTLYAWRVRAELDGAAGPWSDTWVFRTGVVDRVHRFTDITESSGMNGPPRMPLGGHAAAFGDATGNGRPDLYITNHYNEPVADQFFVNQGNGGFLESGASRGIADFDGGSHGAAWGDLDNDGDLDLFNGTTGTTGAPNDIYRNDGRGRFADVTPAAMLERREATRGVALFDMDRDGDLDVFAVSGWRGSGDPSGERNELYRNDGAMRFSPVENDVAVAAPAGQGVTDTDFDGDGDIDLIAANREGNLVVLRNGARGFTLIDPVAIGVVHRAYGGVTSADIDNDGDLDMLLVGLDGVGETIGHLYRNHGSGMFGHVRNFTDIDGYMGGFADLDHDGDLDLVFAGDDLVYLNDGGGEFVPGPRVPVAGISDPRAIAFADIDSDGDLDFAVGVKRSRNWLIRNDLHVETTNWLKIRLRSGQGQAGAFGAKVAVYPPGAGSRPIAVRESRSANGYLGQDAPVLHVGLGVHSRVDIVVTFVDGTTRMVVDVPSNRTVTIDGAAGGSAVAFVERYR